MLIIHISLSWMFCGYKAHLVIELIYAYCYGAYFKAHRQGTHAIMEWFNPHSKPTGLQECSESLKKVWEVKSFQRGLETSCSEIRF